jgi:glutamyl-tRNA synthetase
MTCGYRLLIDPNGSQMNYSAFLVASILNKSNDDSCVEFEYKASGSVPQSFQLMLKGGDEKVLAEGSVKCAQFLIEQLNCSDFAVKDEFKAEWIKFAVESLSGNDFGKLSVSYGRLNEHLKYRTFMLGVEGPSVFDAFIWGQLRVSPVWGKLVKTPNSAAGVEAVRWYNHLNEKFFSEPLAAFAEQGKALKEKKKDQGSFSIDLAGAEMGKVVTRFPPEPSGYLHIGHAKAAMLNQYFAQIYKGEMIIRFDDTNPSKEKCEFEESILEDLALLGVKGDRHSHTSDFFPQIEGFCVQMLQEGSAYADNTPMEKMREERFDGIESACRSQSPEENLRIWEEMKTGSPNGLTYCIRAKMDMTAANKALRDPVMYRCNLTPHHRTGSTYKVYPTYDFACPIVDSLEGVTHALRTNEYHDRNDQYLWFLRTLRLRNVNIWDYSRLNFVYTLLSKRKLTWFVNENRVTGWDDPRFPTVRGIRRRGLTIEALREYILMQGASKNTILLEWDKLWAVNKRIIDPIAPRYVALCGDHLCRVRVIDELESELRPLPRHKKNPLLGEKQVAYSSHLFMEQADVSGLKIGDEFTLMDWGNAIVEGIEMASPEIVACISIRLNLEGDFKRTSLKATWLSPDPRPLVPLALHDYDYLITKKKLEEEDTLDGCLTPVTEFITPAIGDSNLATDVKTGDIVQLERKGFYIVDHVPAEISSLNPIKLISIPDGRAKSIASKHS